MAGWFVNPFALQMENLEFFVVGWGAVSCVLLASHANNVHSQSLEALSASSASDHDVLCARLTYRCCTYTHGTYGTARVQYSICWVVLVYVGSELARVEVARASPRPSLSFFDCDEMLRSQWYVY